MQKATILVQLLAARFFYVLRMYVAYHKVFHIWALKGSIYFFIPKVFINLIWFDSYLPILVYSSDEIGITDVVVHSESGRLCWFERLLYKNSNVRICSKIKNKNFIFMKSVHSL